jgi:CheY-like chemotaxis protein
VAPAERYPDARSTSRRRSRPDPDRRPRAADRRERPVVRALPARHRAREGLQGLVTSAGASALALVRDYQPSAITLDLHLSDIDGWRVSRG